MEFTGSGEGLLRLKSYDDAGSASCVSADSLAPTFRYMLARKLQLWLGGVVVEPNSTHHGAQLFWLFAIAVWWLGFVQLELTSGHTLEMRFELGSRVIAASLAALVFLHFALRVAAWMHWALYWVYAVFLLMVYVALGREAGQDGLLARVRMEAMHWGLPLLAALELLTVIGWFSVHRLAPWALARLRDETIVRLFRLRDSGVAADVGVGVSYSPPWWVLARLARRERSHAFFYTGSVRAGRPHGYGEWRDTDGECLRGYWNAGAPVAPFDSRLISSGDAFSALHVGFITARAEGFAQVYARPRRHAHAGLRVGIVSVECSVSGGFFSYYPQAELLWQTAAAELSASHLRVDAHNHAQVSHCLAHVRHTDEQLDVEAVSVSLALDGDGLEVTGFEPEADAGRGSCVLEVVAARDDLDLGRLESGLASSPEFGSIAPSTLVTHGTAPARSPPREALTDRMPPLPLPRGQSASGEGAVRARRLRVLGWHRNQGSDVLLLIHGFNMSVEHGTQMLAQFLALSRLPPRIKPLVFSWSAATIPTYFCAVAAAKSAEIGRDLRACLQALDASGINDVHVLCHSMGAQVLCHHLERAVVRCGRLRLATVTFLNPEVAEAYFLRQLPRLRAVCPHITVFGDRDDRALFWSERVNGGVPQLGRLRGAPYRVVGAPAQGDASGVLDHDSSTVWADIDCIDCRWLSTNVHKLHHYSFNLNRSLMDDLREIICDRKRAVQRRARLVRRIGNVYSFLQPPPHVVND